MGGIETTLEGYRTKIEHNNEISCAKATYFLYPMELQNLK